MDIGAAAAAAAAHVMSRVDKFFSQSFQEQNVDADPAAAAESHAAVPPATAAGAEAGAPSHTRSKCGTG